MMNIVNDFQPIKLASQEERQYQCPKDFWFRSPICRCCTNMEVELDNEKAYCMCGYK